MKVARPNSQIERLLEWDVTHGADPATLDGTDYYEWADEIAPRVIRVPIGAFDHGAPDIMLVALDGVYFMLVEGTAIAYYSTHSGLMNVGSG